MGDLPYSSHRIMGVTFVWSLKDAKQFAHLPQSFQKKLVYSLQELLVVIVGKPSPYFFLSTMWK